MRVHVVAKGAELEDRLLGVSEIAAYAHNLAREMSSNPHLMIVGSDIDGGLTRLENEEGETRRLPQKIFEVSSSGFMAEQSIAAGGVGSDSALLILENSRLNTKDRNKPARVPKTKKRINKIVEALRGADSSVHGKVRTFLLPNKIGENDVILPLETI